MAKTPRITALEAEKLLKQNGFEIIRVKGSHKVFFRNGKRVVVPFHSEKILHPKIVKQILKSIETENE